MAVIRIKKKGIREFAFGEEGARGAEPFTLDVVTAFQRWIILDDEMRPEMPDESGNRAIPVTAMPTYHERAVEFAESCRPKAPEGEEPYPRVTTAEALEFLARLREEHNDLADFFQSRSRQERESPDSSGAVFKFSPDTGATPATEPTEAPGQS